MAVASGGATAKMASGNEHHRLGAADRLLLVDEPAGAPTGLEG